MRTEAGNEWSVPEFPTNCEPGGNIVNGVVITGRATWPEPGELDAHVGLFPGAFYRRWGSYRPQLRCRMRSVDDTETAADTRRFCIVCRENLLLHILYEAKLVVEHSPASDVVTYKPDDLKTFSITLHTYQDPNHPLEIVWRRDGNVVQQGGTSYDLDTTGLTGSHEVRVSVHDRTPIVHPDADFSITPRVRLYEGHVEHPSNLVSQAVAWQLNEQ